MDKMWIGDSSILVPDQFFKIFHQFPDYSINDSHEFLIFLLNGLHEDLNCVRSKPDIESSTEIEERPDLVSDYNRIWPVIKVIKSTFLSLL